MPHHHRDKHQKAYEEVKKVEVPTEEHKATWTHELIGGAAAFEAMKLYEDKMSADGKPDSHALAKEILAGIAGAAVDRLVETKGLDFIDKEKAKKHAQQEANKIYEEQYEKPNE
ncbi:hypothetical protein BC937DRAFT_89567 [Endogone sp. FLAS-F59071]|nr:hypothetical protein BC937DRAFT_89567 [Endogone sp. FLAS-F59071]|eukprot:RUS17722.1 hypothetical protein BC937DRAFT_89567 [Endogone sp. FLAS-F59071]